MTKIAEFTLGNSIISRYWLQMAYSFKGIFSTASSIHKNALVSGHIFREITVPFSGCGILTPEMSASFEECSNYLVKLGISTDDWIFLEYDTWAGPVEYVFAIGVRSGSTFGPIEADGDAAEDAFHEALESFGLDEGAGVIFAPFERGFWGEV